MSSYCTANELKDVLGINEATDDAILQAYCDFATRTIEDYTHRQFNVTSDTTRYFDAVGEHISGDTLHISDLGDIFAITSIVNGDGNTLANADFTTYPKTLTQQSPVYDRVKLLDSRAKYWTYTTDYENAIAITGRWGYSQTPPATIKAATLRLASFFYRQKDQPLFDVTTVEAGVVISPQGMPNDVKVMLAPFVRR